MLLVSLLYFALVLLAGRVVLRPSTGLAGLLTLGVFLWLVLGTCVAVAVSLARTRPGRQVTVAVLAMVLVAVLCAVPGSLLWTFGDNHPPDQGATCPQCAVITYLSAGPLGGYQVDATAFDGVLCTANRGQLAAQAAQVAEWVRVDLDDIGNTWGFLGVTTSNDRLTLTGTTGTQVSMVTFQFSRNDPAQGILFYDDNAGDWTFQLVNQHGWRVCGVQIPPMCGTVLRCTPTPSGQPVIPPSVPPS